MVRKEKRRGRRSERGDKLLRYMMRRRNGKRKRM